MRTVGIIGLGLMGGSLARDLAVAGWRVLGDDRDASVVAQARSAGVLAGPLPPEDHSTLDLLVLAVPVRAAIDRVHELAGTVDPDSKLVITDVGSTKRSVVGAADDAGLGARFVGSHPIAGSHESGWAAGRPGLFQGRTVWICPTGTTSGRPMTMVESLWRSVGAAPRQIDAADHDHLLALTSHLPQMTATALGTLLASQGLTPDDLGPGGRDVTRLAGSDPRMWTDIALDNADEIAPALHALATTLTALASAVRHQDTQAVRSTLTQGQAWHSDRSA